MQGSTSLCKAAAPLDACIGCEQSVVAKLLQPVRLQDRIPQQSSCGGEDAASHQQVCCLAMQQQQPGSEAAACYHASLSTTVPLCIC